MDFSAFFDMGGYAGYVWPSYVIALVLLAGLFGLSRIEYLRLRKQADQLRARNPRRARRS